jgi:putative transposase
MPYEYRKLSLKKREELVEDRKQRGYPLHAPPHPFRETGVYLITAANFEHQAIMLSPQRRTEFQKILLDGFLEINAEIIGWVILANHYHILVSVESLHLVSNLLKLIHGRTAHKWNLQDGLTDKRKVWYRFADRMMRDEKQMIQTLNYIHYNPVRHGYVRDIYEWEWSSLFQYENENGREWLRNQWKLYTPPPDYGKDWDM